MTINKFGRHLQSNRQQTPHLLRVLKHQVACGNSILRSVSKGIQKNVVYAFSKDCTGNWSSEIFQLVKVNNTNPVTYHFQDETKQPILDGFHEQELQNVKHPDVYLVEKVLKRKGDKVLVQWFSVD